MTTPPRLSRRRLIMSGAAGVSGLAASRLWLPRSGHAEEGDEPAPADEPPPEEAPSEGPPVEEAPAEGPPPPPPFALLEGGLLEPDEAAWLNARLPVAVMVDNLAGGARPQIGLDRADLVYEALVEGGITRLMAVFHRHEAAVVEPVRSVRTPFVHIARELAAIVAHVGAAEAEGDANAAYWLDYWGLPHLDEKQSTAFWRDPYRRVPHNAALSTAAIRDDAAGWGFAGPPELGTWLYKDDFVAANPSSVAVARPMYGFAIGRLPAQPDYMVDWRYDPSTNGYLRVSGGARHVDAVSGAWLWAKNVVVQFQQAAVVTHEGHVIYEQVGEGPASVFQDGYVIEATWSCRWIGDRTRYWDANGEEIRFNRGPTWVALLPHGSPLWME